MREVFRTAQFKRDVKRMEKRGHDMEKLKELILILLGDQPLPATYKGHPRSGQWKNYRDSHIAPDWLLIYKVTDTLLSLVRTWIPCRPLLKLLGKPGSNFASNPWLAGRAIPGK